MQKYFKLFIFKSFQIKWSLKPNICARALPIRLCIRSRQHHYKRFGISKIINVQALDDTLSVPDMDLYVRVHRVIYSLLQRSSSLTRTPWLKFCHHQHQHHAEANECHFLFNIFIQVKWVKIKSKYPKAWAYWNGKRRRQPTWNMLCTLKKTFISH